MRINTLDYFKFKKFASKSQLDLPDFFIEFSKCYVKSAHDFATLSKDFYFTMLGLKSHLCFVSGFQENNFEGRLADFCRNRHLFLMPKSRVLNDQAPYVDILRNIISSDNNVLDVGGGPIPYSSILMRDYFKKVGAIDKRFTVSEKALSKAGIEPKIACFTDQTPIDNYDFVVGSKPCSAIRGIVENCHNSNKGYVIKLCNCDLNSFAYRRMAGHYENWSEVLPEIDPSVKFYESGKNFFDHCQYAFNLDITEEQFAKIEEESREKDVSSLENSFFNELKTYAVSHIIKMPPEITENSEEQN